MNVLEIVADGSRGGGTTHVLQILRGLRDRYAFTLVTQQGSELLREARALGTPVFGLDFLRGRLDPRLPLALRRLASRVQPDVVHVHGGRAGFLYALARCRMPTVLTVHGFHFAAKQPIVRRLALLAERVAAGRADHIIFVSDHDLRTALAEELIPDLRKASLVRHGLPPGTEPTGSPRPNHVGFIGRMVDEKDPLLFLDIVEALPEYEATMVGGGALDAAVRERIAATDGLSTRVRVLGPLEHDRAREELATFSVLVMTSRREAFGLVGAEALASGVPVVAPRVGGVPELVEHERTGLLVDDRSAEEFATAVKRLSDEPELRERIAAEGRRRVRELCSEDEMLAAVAETYDRLGRR